MQKTLNEHKAELASLKLQAEARKNAAFKIEEISNANKHYIDTMFSAMTSEDDLTDDVQKASLAYQNALKKHGFSACLLYTS